MLARMHVQKEIRQRPLQTRAPAFIQGKTRTGNLCRRAQIQNSRLFADLPMRLRLKIIFKWRAPVPHFHVVRRACAGRHRGMRNIRHRQQHFPLPRIELRHLFVRLFDELGELLHLRDNRICVLFLFFQSRNFIAIFVPLRLALLVRRNKFPPRFVQYTECVQIQRRPAALRHLGENVQILPKIAQVMHGPKRIA